MGSMGQARDCGEGFHFTKPPAGKCTLVPIEDLERASSLLTQIARLRPDTPSPSLSSCTFALCTEETGRTGGGVWCGTKLPRGTGSNVLTRLEPDPDSPVIDVTFI